jgi:hypothetical protein
MTARVLCTHPAQLGGCPLPRSSKIDCTTCNHARKQEPIVLESARRRDVLGTVYLIHFESPFKHAKHHLGWTEGPLELRLGDHRTGRGARLMKVVTAAGVDWRLARTWPDATRTFERRLKKHSGTRYCPVCNPSGKQT